ncbi:MAG: nickel-binding protein [Aquaticitalea sp.]
MPIYMDRHDIPEEITAEHVAQMHQEDLKVQHLFGCKGMTYWCDEKRRTAFCLFEAPNKQAIQDMHNRAHGDCPHIIIEVNERIVESFLGRIEDPEKSQDTALNIINDPAFRVLMIIETSNYLDRLEANQYTIFTHKFHNSVAKKFQKYNGNIVKKDNHSYLVSFKTVTDAVLCAQKIQFQYKYVTPTFEHSSRKIKIALCSGIPITDKDEIFKETIDLATRMCTIVKDSFVITSEVNALYESENRNAVIDEEMVSILSPLDEKFITHLMDYTEDVWNNTELDVLSFSKALGFSKSQFYRKLTSLTGKSPNTFLRDYRLDKSLKLLH